MASFAELIKVKQLDSHTYEANLPAEWAIGTVPHGGAVTSILQSASHLHFTSTLSHLSQPDLIILHLTFARRTSIGPALITIQDLKLGRQTSTIQITLSQSSRPLITGLLTHSNLALEKGLSLPTSWRPSPAPPGTDLRRLEDSLRMEGKGGGGGRVEGWGPWRRWTTPNPSFRHAPQNCDIFVLHGTRSERGVIEQYIRLKSGEPFTNLSLGLLVDLFPQMAESYVDDAEALASAGVDREGLRKQWYPTLALNLDVKRRLPEGGVRWVYVRVEAKRIRNGRKDLEVVVCEEGGEVVAVSNHVAMIVGAERNRAARGEGREKEKL